jgi:hypothetical protein
MAPPYTDIAFTSSQPDQPTAMKLNKLRDDLSKAIAAGGGGTGTGDMTKAIYDTNNNGKVDTCDSLAWTSVTGKPVIGDMTKAVYDINGDGISDHAALADAVPWTGVSGKPATFPPDSTAMLKATYDVNGNGVVDTCDSLAWGKLTGVPATFPPDSTAMLKSVYDINGDGISDHAALADTAPWTGITGKPATFPPSAHGATHLDNGTDVIPVVTAVRTGLAPKLSGIAGTYLDGTGAYSSPSGSGDMTKSVYDTNGNGVVDTADAIPWASITGKPTGNLVDPGTWTNLSLGAGWTAPTQAQYRIEVNGAVSTVRFRGMIQAAYSALGTTAFTAPAGAQPSMTRSCVLGGAQATGTPSDVASYLASVSSAGVATIYFLAASAFVWADPAQTQAVYLDGLFYSL